MAAHPLRWVCEHMQLPSCWRHFPYTQRDPCCRCTATQHNGTACLPPTLPTVLKVVCVHLLHNGRHSCLHSRALPSGSW
jgi:hypothetical protein